MKGLSEADAQKRLKEFGPNSIEIGKRISLFSLLISQYKNVITLILFLATIFSFSIREEVDGLFILLVLLANGLFGFFQEYKAEKTLEKLRNFTIPRSRVMRDGYEKEIDTKGVVPGDVAVLREGDRIPADGVLISSIPLEVDESIFTGESLPVAKTKGDFLLSGTFILRGRGEMEVEKTGFSTRLGEIVTGLSEIEKPKTPLGQNLDQLGKKIAISALAFSLFLIPFGLIQQREVKQLVLTVVSLAVAVIPEGLPLVVTIALAVGAYRMAHRKAIVRKMASIETLGATNIILTDKTGTLTQNKMSVKTHWLHSNERLETLLRACALGNTATFMLKEDGGEFEVLGDKTDVALSLFVQKHLGNFDEFRSEGRVLFEKPFDPLSKTIEVEWEDQKGSTYIFVRGAPETIIDLLGTKEKVHAAEKFLSFAKEGLRVIGFAYRTKSNPYRLLGFVGIYDPPRKEASRAVLEAKDAGIRVVMVTGDNQETAKNIAEEIGLIQKEELVVTSSELERLSDRELLDILPRVRIFARARPEDKLRLVRVYQKAGFVVAVTGDGVNDALALQESNIGVAMGQSGTDVARETADIVITDDNLYTIVHAVEEGRAIFHNIVRVVLYLLSANLAEFLVISASLLMNLPIALLPTQILWINLVTDGLPALALAADMKRKGLLASKPRDTKEQILSRDRMMQILKIAGVLTVFTMVLYVVFLRMFSEQEARLLVFNLFVLLELVVVFVIRGGVLPINKFLLTSIIISLLLQALIMVHPILRGIFS